MAKDLLLIKARELESLLLTTLENTLAKDKHPGLLFSGGLDSSILAALLKNRLNVSIPLIVSGTAAAKDIIAAQFAAEALNLPLTIQTITKKTLRQVLPKILSLIETPSELQVSLAIPLFHSALRAKELGLKQLFCGQGADELFAGYARHERSFVKSGEIAVGKEMKKDLERLFKETLPTQARLMQHLDIELEMPFIDPNILKFSEDLSVLFKIDYSSCGVIRKKILRALAQKIELPDKVATAPKRAAQYGSGASRLLAQLALDYWQKQKPSLSRREAKTKHRIQQYLIAIKRK
jgi:asparagine synthase (glutamine-hydrolysing)